MTSYVYLRPTRSGEPHTVGFYDPTGKWHPESDHGTPEDAGRRVAYLNGADVGVHTVDKYR
jgi:hypothetical protein